SSLGGTGRVQLQSNGLGSNFQLVDRNLAFRYAYITNDPNNAATHDRFQVQIDFYSSAGALTPTTTQTFTIAQSATQNDTGSFSPFNTAGAAALNNGAGSGG